MSKAKADLDYWILHFFNQNTSPQGAGTVLEAIREKGIRLSEAAIGRQMRVLRVQGLLEKVGKQGHLITPAGKDKLHVLEGEKDLRDFLGGIAGKQALQGTGNLIDRLIARKALEREAAYQATLNATDEELLEIERIVQKQYEGMRMNQEYSEISADFHRAIFQAARVPLLEALYDFIGISSRWQNFFVGTFKIYNTPLNVSHEKIIKAMKARDAELAADSMAAHLEDVISNAKKLFPGSIKKAPTKN
ncbi:MAG: FCD domain-containing protein [Synergistales bacterium]